MKLSRCRTAECRNLEGAGTVKVRFPCSVLFSRHFTELCAKFGVLPCYGLMSCHLPPFSPG